MCQSQNREESRIAQWISSAAAAIADAEVNFPNKTSRVLDASRTLTGAHPDYSKPCRLYRIKLQVSPKNETERASICL